MAERLSLHMRVPESLIVRLDRQADRMVVSRNWLIQRAIEAALERLEDDSDRLDDEAMEGRR